jgi:hypothetical protein
MNNTTPLTDCKTETDFFNQISPIVLQQYEKEHNIVPLYKDAIYEKKSRTIVFVNVSVPYNPKLFDYKEFTKWFIKPNFKYTFYKHTTNPHHTPQTLYIDHIFINRYYVSNDYAEIINRIVKPQNIIHTIFNSFWVFILALFYSQKKKVYISTQYIMREPGKLTLNEFPEIENTY